MCVCEVLLFCAFIPPWRFIQQLCLLFALASCLQLWQCSCHPACCSAFTYQQVNLSANLIRLFSEFVGGGKCIHFSEGRDFLNEIKILLLIARIRKWNSEVSSNLLDAGFLFQIVFSKSLGWFVCLCVLWLGLREEESSHYQSPDAVVQPAFMVWGTGGRSGVLLALGGKCPSGDDEEHAWKASGCLMRSYRPRACWQCTLHCFAFWHNLLDFCKEFLKYFVRRYWSRMRDEKLDMIMWFGIVMVNSRPVNILKHNCCCEKSEKSFLAEQLEKVRN